MKRFFALLLIVAACGLVIPQLFVKAQENRSRGLGARPEKSLEQVVRKYERLTLDPAAAERTVRAGGRLSLAAAQHRFDLDLQPHDLRAANYRAEETGGDGVRRELTPAAPVHTYKGSVRGQSKAQARFTLDGQTIEGMILTPEERYYVEPLSKYEAEARATDFVLYKKSDVIEDAEAMCGTMDGQVGEALKGVEPQLAAAATTQAASGMWYEAEIATEADYEYVKVLGGSSAAADAEVISTMNMVDGVYETETGITFKIVYQHTWAAKPVNYPYTSTENGGAVLQEFANYWNTSFTNVTRDLAHLWTGKNIVDENGDTGLIGIAWISSVCAKPQQAYGVSQRMSTAARRAILAAHEIGHNFGADHSTFQMGCDTNTIMNAYIGTALTFCQASRDSITTFSGQNAGCLKQVPACSYTLSSTSVTILSAGGTGSVSVTSGSTCDWMASSNTSWIKLTSSANGLGSQTVSFTVPPYTGQTKRTGTLTIARQTFTVTQLPPLAVKSLTLKPSVIGGNEFVGVVALNNPAPPSGAVVKLADDLAATNVPADLTFASGESTKSFRATTSRVSAAQAGTVTAQYGTTTVSTPFSVEPLVITSLALSTNTVIGSLGLTGTITFNGHVPSGGAVVALSDDLNATTLPASLNVAAGAPKGTFKISTAVVLSKQVGLVTAAYGGASLTAGLTVRPVGVLNVSVSPSSVVGGNAITGTVTLERPAPVNLNVTLAHTVASVTVPTKVVVPSGATKQTFTMTTKAVTSFQRGTLTASLNETSNSVAFGVNPPPSTCTKPIFRMLPITAGGTYRNFVLADFNRDSSPDLAALGSGLRNLEGDGAGGFRSVASYSLSTNAVAVGDFNLDGKQDMVAYGEGTQYVNVYLGNGAGGFGTPLRVNSGLPSTNTSVYDMAVGDFNRDGKPDLAVPDVFHNRLVILLGDGLGRFALSSDVTAPGRPRYVATGDFNRDGKLDVVATDLINNAVSIFLGNGAGGLTSAGQASAGVIDGGNATMLVAGDFNGDAVPDLSLAYTGTNHVTVLFGNGAGGFSAPKFFTFNSLYYPHAVAVGDLNGDGKADLAVSQYAQSFVSVFYGDGAGGFSTPVRYNLPSYHYIVRLAVGDFTGDGRADLVTMLNDGITVMVGACN